MDFRFGILTFGTLGFAVAFGYLSARYRKTQRQRAPQIGPVTRRHRRAPGPTTSGLTS